jgi:hypothetical protein
VNFSLRFIPKIPMFLVTPLLPNHERITPIIEPPNIKEKTASSGTNSPPLKNKI